MSRAFATQSDEYSPGSPHSAGTSAQGQLLEELSAIDSRLLQAEAARRQNLLTAVAAMARL